MLLDIKNSSNLFLITWYFPNSYLLNLGTNLGTPKDLLIPCFS
jgi:hypothetical protein